jgi:hypothetical protein
MPFDQGGPSPLFGVTLSGGVGETFPALFVCDRRNFIHGHNIQEWHIQQVQDVEALHDPITQAKPTLLDRKVTDGAHDIGWVEAIAHQRVGGAVE